MHTPFSFSPDLAPPPVSILLGLIAEEDKYQKWWQLVTAVATFLIALFTVVVLIRWGGVICACDCGEGTLLIAFFAVIVGKDLHCGFFRKIGANYPGDWKFTILIPHPLLLWSTLVCWQLTELIWDFFFLFHKFSNFISPPPLQAWTDKGHGCPYRASSCIWDCHSGDFHDHSTGKIVGSFVQLQRYVGEESDSFFSITKSLHFHIAASTNYIHPYHEQMTAFWVKMMNHDNKRVLPYHAWNILVHTWKWSKKWLRNPVDVHVGNTALPYPSAVHPSAVDLLHLLDAPLENRSTVQSLPSWSLSSRNSYYWNKTIARN